MMTESRWLRAVMLATLVGFGVLIKWADVFMTGINP